MAEKQKHPGAYRPKRLKKKKRKPRNRLEKIILEHEADAV